MQPNSFSKILIALELHGILSANFACSRLDTGMQNKDNASPSISVAGHGLLVKMCIAIEPHGIFCSNFAYLYILTLSGHWNAKRRRCFCRTLVWLIKVN